MVSKKCEILLTFLSPVVFLNRAVVDLGGVAVTSTGVVISFISVVVVVLAGVDVVVDVYIVVVVVDVDIVVVLLDLADDIIVVVASLIVVTLSVFNSIVFSDALIVVEAVLRLVGKETEPRNIPLTEYRCQGWHKLDMKLMIVEECKCICELKVCRFKPKCLDGLSLHRERSSRSSELKLFSGFLGD